MCRCEWLTVPQCDERQKHCGRKQSIQSHRKVIIPRSVINGENKANEVPVSRMQRLVEGEAHAGGQALALSAVQKAGSGAERMVCHRLYTEQLLSRCALAPTHFRRLDLGGRAWLLRTWDVVLMKVFLAARKSDAIWSCVSDVIKVRLHNGILVSCESSSQFGSNITGQIAEVRHKCDPHHIILVNGKLS